MFELLSKSRKKKDFPFNIGNMPVNGGAKQLTITEKTEYCSYADELTGEIVTIKRSVRTESRERVTVIKRNCRR